MLFHAKALEIYSQCFNEVDNLHEIDDLEVRQCIYLLAVILSVCDVLGGEWIVAQRCEIRPLGSKYGAFVMTFHVGRISRFRI